MKKFLLTITCSFALLTGQAQLPANSICPDFTGTDLEGNTWNLYELLDSGKTVIIEVSAAWCAPCWNYHQSNILKNFYNQYGPEGTNEAMVLFIEGEPSNTSTQLYAAANTGLYATHSQGNWVAGTPFPIIDNASIANLLDISTYPTFFMVCPDRVITYADGYYVQGGQIHPNLNDWATMMNHADCSAATAEVDPRFIDVTSLDAECSEPTAGVKIFMQNKGTTPLTEATITITGAGDPIVYDWTGNLETYETTTIVINGIDTDGNTLNVTVEVTSEDEVPSNSSVEVSVNSTIQESTTHIRVVFVNDPWPGENRWKIRDSNGTVIASSPSFPAQVNSASTNTYDYWVPSQGCYTFEFEDDYGDGLAGAQYGAWNGSLKVYSVNETGNQSPLFIYNGNYALDFVKFAFEANTTVGTDEIETGTTALNVYPNPTSGIVNLNYSLDRTVDVLVDVIDAVGVRVMSERIGSQAAGTYTTPIDLSSLAAGIYMVNLNADGVTSSVRVIVK